MITLAFIAGTATILSAIGCIAKDIYEQQYDAD